MVQPIKQKLAPTKKCIPGIPGKNDFCFAPSPEAVAAKAANSDAYMEEPIAPVNSDREPAAPSKAPASPGGARFASRACNAGIVTAKNKCCTDREKEKTRRQMRRRKKQRQNCG